MRKHQTTIHLEEKDKEAIAAIREHYGIPSDVGAIRLALRELLRSLNQTSPPITPQKDSTIVRKGRKETMLDRFDYVKVTRADGTQLEGRLVSVANGIGILASLGSNTAFCVSDVQIEVLPRLVPSVNLDTEEEGIEQ